MKKPNSFYVLYPEEEMIRRYINAIKILSDSKQRTEAHITVRGPYKKRLSNELIKNYSNVISGESLIISDVQNFFAFNQNTVYFKCSHNDNLKKIWNKITYNSFTPHITLYDGGDRNFAIKLYNKLARGFEPFNYKVKELSYLEPKSNDAIGLYRLINVFKFNDFVDLINKQIDRNEIDNIANEKKLEYIHLISQKIFTEYGINATANNKYT